MVNHFIANDLGIYNNYYMYEKNSKPDTNKHMEHGLEFINFKEYETPWFFDIVCVSKEYKDRIKTHLNSHNIETRDSYPALSFQKYLKEYTGSELNHSESISERILWLPSSNNLTKEQIEKISEAISTM